MLITNIIKKLINIFKTKNIVIFLIVFLLKNNYDVFYYLLAVIVPQSVYTGIASIALYRLLYSINNKVEKKERETRRLF